MAHRKDIAYRVGVSLLILVWVHVYPLFLLTIYFANRGFLSFDLLTEGLLGMNSVFAWMVFVLLLFAAYQWGFFALVADHLKFVRRSPGAAGTQQRKPIDKWLWVSTFLIGGLVWFSIIWVTTRATHPNWLLVVAVSVFSLSLTFCLFLFLREDLKSAAINWQAPLFFLATSLFLPIVGSGAAVELIDLGLRQFRAGGLLDTRVERIDAKGDNALIAEGRLLLLSSRNIYLETGDSTHKKLVVLANSQNLKVEVNSTYGHDPR
jgi:hypothetical protein